MLKINKIRLLLENKCYNAYFMQYFMHNIFSYINIIKIQSI